MSNPAGPPAFRAVFRNEIEKIWVKRSKALIIALIILIAGVSLVSAHTYHQNYQQAAEAAQNNQQAATQMRQQIAQTQRALKSVPRGKKRALQQQLAQQQQALQQIQTGNGGTVNERLQVRSLQNSLSTIPTQRGPMLEQLALARYRVSHGLISYNPAADSGMRLVGLVFGGDTIVLFALIAVVIASDTVSSELQSGTWGILLLHAPRRRQVYLAKWGAALLILWGFMLAATVGIFAFSSVLMGVGSTLAPHVVGTVTTLIPQNAGPSLVVPAQQIFHIIPQWSYDLLALVLAMLSLGGFVTLLVGLSVTTRSTVGSLIIGVLVLISGFFAALLGPASLLDPAVSFPLISDWTGTLAMQDNVRALTLGTGLAVTIIWAAAALAVGLWRVARTDV